MRIVHDPANLNSRAPVLAILLPGALQPPEQFIDAGFVEAVRQRELALDLAMIDLNLQFIGEATDGSALARLHEFVTTQQAHYREIWLAGISIGGFMAMAYVQSHPGQIAGLCLLAPYPGNRMLANEIRAAGGLPHWQTPCADNDDECRVWQWLQRFDVSTLRHMYYGYARQDRFAAGQQLMAQAFPAPCVDVVEGTHDWPAWQQLWNNFLDRIDQPLMHQHSPCN